MGFLYKPDPRDLFEAFYGELEEVVKNALRNEDDVEVWRDGSKLIVGIDQESATNRYLVPGRVLVFRREGRGTGSSVELIISKAAEDKISVIESALSKAGLSDDRVDSVFQPE